MRLADHAYALPLSLELRGHELTIHPGAVETDDALLLFDVGTPGAADDLEAALGEHGFDFEDVEGIIVTHQDADHAGALSEVVERSDATVYAHVADTPYVEGDEELLKSSPERPMSYEGTPVDVQIVGGEVFRTAAGPLRVVYTPGHTPGHCSLFLEDAGLTS